MTAFPVSVRLKLASQKFVLAKISNKRPFLKMEMVGAYLIIFPDRVGSYSSGVFIRRGAYSRVYVSVGEFRNTNTDLYLCFLKTTVS